MAIQIQFRRGTASQWSSANTTLGSGELGYETDTTFYKIGNGTTAWTDLPYVTAQLAYNALYANSATYLGGVVSTDYQLTSGLASNVALLAANAATYLNGNSALTLRNYSESTACTAYSNAVVYVDTRISTVNSAITANATTAYANAVYDAAADATTKAGAAISYTNSKIGTANTAMVANAVTAYTNAVSYTDSKFSTVNSAITTAYTNAVSYVDGKGFALLSGAAFTGNVSISGNLIVTGTTVTINATTLDVKDLNITVAKGAASASAADGAGLTVDGAAVGWYYNYSSNTWQSNVGITPSSNNAYNLGSSGLVWSNVYANNIVSSNIYGTIQTTSQPNITANSANFIGGLYAANVVSNAQLIANLANYQTSAGLATNVATLAANSASYLGTVDAASYVQNTDSRTLSGNLNFTGTNTYFSGKVTHNANLVLNAGINVIDSTGSRGTTGQVLTSNGTGNVYWGTVVTSAVTSVGSGNGLTGGPITSTGSLSVLANTGIISNSSGVFVNSAYISSLSSTDALTANSATYLGGKSESNLNVNSALTSNSSSYIGSLPAANVVSNTQLSANLANYTNSSNLPTVINNNTANDVYYVNGVTSVNVVSNAQLIANLANYTNSSSFYLDTLVDVNAAGPSSGQILTWNSTTNLWTPQAPPTVVTGVTPGYYGSFYDANANQTISSTTSAYLIRVANTFEQNGITVVNNTDITFAYTGTYEIIYSIQFFNNDNAQQDINIWFYKNGNNNIDNSDSKFTVNGKSGSNKGKIIAVTPFISTFNAGDYVRLAWAATATGVAITTDSAGTTPTTPVVPGVIVTVKQVSNIISAPPGTNSQIMFNDSGVSNATAGFTFNKTTNNITIGNSLFVTSTVNAAAFTVGSYFTVNSTFVYANNGINFKPKASAPPVTIEGSVFYDSQNHALNVYTDGATPQELGQQSFARVYNASGSTITRGTAVYINGANANRPTIAPAIANSTLSVARSIGIVFDDIPATSEGFVLTRGLFQTTDTRNFAIGQEIYLSATSAGGLSNSVPTYPYFYSPLGYSLNSALNGQIFINVAEPSLILPNTNIYISNGSSAFVSNNFTFDYANSVLRIGNSTVNGSIGYINTTGTTTFLRLNGNSNSSLDADITNYNLGSNASSDFAAYDSNGPEGSNFIDMGIAGVNFSQSFWTISGPSDGYLYTGNSALAIGTAVSSPIKFFTGGTLAANERARITETGNVGINNSSPTHKLSVNGTTYFGGNVTISTGVNILDSTGSQGTAGQVLASNGTGNVYWTSTAGVNVNNPYSWTNVHTFSGNVALNGPNNVFQTMYTVGAQPGVAGNSVSANTTALLVGNSTVYTTINSTAFSGTAANATNLNGLSASSYALLSGAAFTGNVTISGNLIVTGTTVTVNATNLDVKDLNITVAKGVATAAAADGAGLTVDTAGIGWYYNYASNTWQSNVGITPSANNTFDLGNTNLRWSNVYANNIVGSNLYGTIQTTSQPNITANNANYLGTVAASNYVNTSGNYTLAGNLNFTGTNNYFSSAVYVGSNVIVNTSSHFVGNSTVNTNITAGAISISGATVATQSYVTGLGYLTSIAGSGNVAYDSSRLNNKTESNLNVNSALSSNSSAYLNNKTESNLNVNSALSSNSSAYLGAVAAASYVQNTDSRTLSGNLTFTGNSSFNGRVSLSSTSDLIIANGAGIQANGVFGTQYQVLTADGNGNVYWAAASGGFTNSQSISVTNLEITGAVAANSSNGGGGQVLTSNGTGVYWAPAGASPVNAVRQLYVADGTTNVFTVTGGYVANNLDVFINGVKLQTNIEANVQSGSTFTIITDTPPVDSVIEVLGLVTSPTVDYTKYVKTFNITGSFSAPITGVARYVPITNTVITAVRMTNASNIVGSDLIAQIYKNGVYNSTYTLTAGNYTSYYSGLGIVLNNNDYITVNITQGVGNNFSFTISN